MKIGVLVPITEKNPDVVTIARRVEALGFDSLWIPEHPIIPVEMKTPFPASPDGKLPEHYAHWADPFVTLTMAAAVTQNIKLATGICLVPERDPLVTAKVVASLDLFSKGRVILGVGGGWLREETEVMGTRFGLRWQRLRESVEAMKALWTRDEAGYQGETVHFPPVKCYPKPYQKPHPPVLLGAHGPKALARVARYCEGWFPLGVSPEAAAQSIETIRRLAQESGRQLERLDVTVIVGPENGGPSQDLMQRYRDAGVGRLVVFSQEMGTEMAEGRAMEHIERLAPIVERAQKV